MRRTRQSLDQLAGGGWKPQTVGGDVPEVEPSAENTDDAGK
jgi:hypothetical protein